MPELTNPTDQDLYCDALAEIVPAGESVEVSDEQAARINTACGVWRVSAPPVRETVKRGGKRAEVTSAPAMETR